MYILKLGQRSCSHGRALRKQDCFTLSFRNDGKNRRQEIDHSERAVYCAERVFLRFRLWKMLIRAYRVGLFGFLVCGI